MSSLKLYAVSHKEFRDSAIENLTIEEKKSVYSYIVNESYPKNEHDFTNNVEHIKEYELPEYNKVYQDLRYSEYSLLPHCYKNSILTENLTHIGMLHNDVVFKSNSINDIILSLKNNPNQLFCNTFFGPLLNRDGGPLYFSREQLFKICDYLSIKLKMFINPQHILTFGWIGSMCIAPIKVFIDFGKFIHENYEEINDILYTDKWNLQDYTNKHTPCGFVERMWGFYLVSLGMPINKMNIIHADRNSYVHDYGSI